MKALIYRITRNEQVVDVSAQYKYFIVKQIHYSPFTGRQLKLRIPCPTTVYLAAHQCRSRFHQQNYTPLTTL